MGFALNTVKERINSLDVRIVDNVDIMDCMENKVSHIFNESKVEYLLFSRSTDLDEQHHSYAKHETQENIVAVINRKRALILIETKLLLEEKDFLYGLLESMDRTV